MSKDKEKLQEKDFTDNETKITKKRSRKTIGEEGSRKQTAVVLLTSLVLGLGFYLPKEIKNWWQSFNQIETIRIEKSIDDEKDVSEVVGFKVVIKQKNDAQEVVEELIKDSNGDYGVWVESLESGEGFYINKDMGFGAASVAKMMPLVEYYKKVDNGEIDPDKVYILKEKDRLVYGTGSMQNQSAGTEYTYQEVAELTANQSDNMGVQLLSRWVNKKMPEEMELDEVASLFKDLYHGKILSDDSRQKLFDSLTNTVNEDRITAGVPSEARVVHKFGSEKGIVNDCGIVFPPKALQFGRAGADYVICMMSDRVNEGEAQEVLPKISRVVWEWLGE